MLIYIQSVLSNFYILVLLSGLISFLIANRIFPPLIWTLRQRHLLDEPDDRSAHGETTPTMGGVGIYISFSFTLIILASILGLKSQDLITVLSLVGATMILLFLGVKDDLVPVPPKKKILGQLVAAAIVVVLANIRIYSFGGLLGIEELPYFFSVLFSIFVFVTLINAFNLIDGVDGLAGFIALVVNLAFGVFFFLNEQVMHLLVSCILTGAIIGFLRYNFSEEKKIFMGDTGSMVVGFLLCFQALSFLELNAQETAQFSVSNGPVMALAVLSYPILDTLRVFIIRIRDGRSPFSADRNHIHHRCLGLGLNHKKTTLLLTILNLFVIEFAFLTNDLYINVHAFMILVVVPLVYELPFIALYQWLPNLFGIQTMAQATKIEDKAKVIPMTNLGEQPSTYLGSTPHMYSEYIYQPLKNQGKQGQEPKDEEDMEAQKISSKRIATFQKAKDQTQLKRKAK